jgi:flagellar hook-basal body complex protein FliE
MTCEGKRWMLTPIAAAGIDRVAPLNLQPVVPSQAGLDGAADPQSFSGLLRGALNDANAAQISADQAVQRLAAGEGGDIHQVMLAMEQARLSMLMVVEVRNKLVEAYQEVSRMPL